jgi:hypothetical protein
MERGTQQSDIARIREQYELEYQAGKRGLEGTAISASHRFITVRMENMWEHFQRLTTIAGQAEAHRIAFGEPLPEKKK